MILFFIIVAYATAVEPLATSPSILGARPHNLTHSSYLYYDFSDETFDVRYDPKYTRGKHCAAQYLAIDYNTHSYGHDLFENCVRSVHPLAVHGYAVLTTRSLFKDMYAIFDNYTRHVFLHDEETDSLYETYVDIQHDFSTYKIDIVQAATSFTHPVNALSMSTSPTDAKKALKTSTDIMERLYNTVKIWGEMYDTVIDGKATKLTAYQAVENAEWLRLHEQQHTYIANVSTMLKQLTLVPNVYENCNTGHWCVNGQATACPAGTFQPAHNMTRSLACIQTPVGTYAKAGAANWTACPANTHVGATACHVRPLQEMVRPGVLVTDFYVTYDFTRVYENGTLLTTAQTANATTGPLLQRLQNLTAAGTQLVAAYMTAKLEQLRNESTTLFDNTDLDTDTYLNQSDLTSFRIPYADGLYNVSVGVSTWSIAHVQSGQTLVSGTRNGTVLSGVPSTVKGMVFSNGYPMVDINTIKLLS
tara:strand:+ start:591 stop:2015 length:1425 start_codon:yes stop_codon:yes gene_type:complete